jgi:SNF2 family DNA or RNA helicase
MTNSLELHNPPSEESLILAKHPESQIFYGRKLTEKGAVSLSFVKGQLDRHLVVSGIVADNNTTYETKLTYRAEGQEVKFNCQCKLFPQEGFCVHGVALWFKWRSYQASGLALESSTPQGLRFLGEGVQPEAWGTLLRNAQNLPGSKPNSTFSSLTYRLLNRQVIHYPDPIVFKGKLLISLRLAHSLEHLKQHEYLQGKWIFHFSWLAEGTLDSIKEISLFDIFHLFNWKTGQLFSLPAGLSECLKKIKNFDTFFPAPEGLRILNFFQAREDVQVFLNDFSFDQIPSIEPIWRFSITPSVRKSFLNLELQFLTPDMHMAPLPEILKVFATENGWSSGFRTKNDAAHFLKILIEDLNQDVYSAQYRKHIHTSSHKQHLQDWIEELREPQAYYWDPSKDHLYDLNQSKLCKFMTLLNEVFTEQCWRSVFYREDERKLQWQFPKNLLLENAAKLNTGLKALGSDLYYNDKIVQSWRSAIRFERKNQHLNWFELEVSLSQEDLQTIQNFDLDQDFILNDSGLILLSEREKDLMRFMKRYTKIDGEKKSNNTPGMRKFGVILNKARVFELFELKKLGIEGTLTPEEETFCEKILNLEQLPQHHIPARYVDLARAYQLIGFQWLYFLWDHKFGACLADDMGLGKTLQTIMLLQALVDEQKIKRALIICPVSILYNWKSELDRFSSLKVGTFYGTEREIPHDCHVVLTSYGLMKKEALDSLGAQEWDIVIFDEVQHLKNIKSLGASAARNLRATFRICLTGTPVENDLSEFYNILDLCVPGVWGDLSLVRSSVRAKNRLVARRVAKPFILRRTKDQVLKELPEKIENHVFLDFSEGERQFYDQRLGYIKNQMLSQVPNKKYGEVLKSLLELRQLCLWQKPPTQSSLQSTKIDFLLENLEQLISEKHKVLIFSQFTTYLDFIQDQIRVQGWKYARIDGSMTVQKREQQVESFQKGDAQIFLISLKAGGFGLNLTAASYIFLMDPWWNPAVERQAIDRAHRIGQENKLTVYRPIIKNSVEEKVLILQDSKRELFRDLMAEDDENYFSGKLTKDDFQMLLS